MRAADAGAARRGGDPESRWCDPTQILTPHHISPTSLLRIVADALRRVADRLESAAASIARRRLLRLLGDAMRGAVLPRHAQASHALDALDARLAELRAVAQ